MARCGVEIFVGGAWERVGEVHAADERAGFGGAARFEYDFEYLERHFERLGAIDELAVSCRYPISYDVHDEARWPAFLLDVIPSGAARRFWERELDLPNAPSSDWLVLVHGAAGPPGNLRVAEAVPDAAPAHRGFARAEVVARADRFLEYAREHGAAIAGATGAGGDAPKLLLREDRAGRWHADGALEDAKTRRAWLVKFPRGRAPLDRVVLESEAAYHRVARRFGARASAELVAGDGCLFVPRFDRAVANGRVERFGLESLCSLAGVSDFGLPVAKEAQIAALARYASDPRHEVRELLLRDVLDVALGNTDNHARNTAVLKRGGRVELSPLYDFAPMCLDPEGIARVCRWQAEAGGWPRWGDVAEALAPHLDPHETRAWLASLAQRARALPEWLEGEGIDGRVLEEVRPRALRVARDLAGLL